MKRFQRDNFTGSGGAVIPARRQGSRFNLLAIIVLLGFGLCQSIFYFGYQPVPSPDFSDYLAGGRYVLSGRLPPDFTRPPVLGILIVSLSKFLGGPTPELAAGWLLNALLHPLNLLWFWLVGRKIIGDSAIWFALIASVNPYLVKLSMDPIVETTFLFFILAAFFCIFRGSRMSYFFAAIAALVRYEGAVLIPAAAVIDLARAENRRERMVTLLYAGGAALPVLAWVLGGISRPGGIYYLTAFNQNQDPLPLKIYQIWQVAFSSFLGPFSSPLLLTAGKIIAVLGCLFGLAGAFLGRRRRILALFIFLAGYFVIHLFYLTLWRYWVPVAWILLLIWWSGWQTAGKAINPGSLLSRGGALAIGVLFPAATAVWFLNSRGTPPGGEIPGFPFFASLGAVAILWAGRLYYCRDRYWLRDLAAALLAALILVFNFNSLAGVIGNGGRNMEFKQLARWYGENAAPGEKIVCTLASLLLIYNPGSGDDIIPLRGIQSPDPEEFIRECRLRGVTYIAWDSRMCSDEKWRFYQAWGIGNIRALSRPRSTGPYEFVIRIVNESDPKGYINVFRLR